MDQRGRWPDLAFDRPLAALLEEATPSHFWTITPHEVRRCGGPDVREDLANFSVDKAARHLGVAGI